MERGFFFVFVSPKKKIVKIAVLLDGTGSMAPLLQAAKFGVHTMFERVSSILKANNRDPKSFSLQFIVYRNYNAPPDELLEYSGWSNDPNDLKKFLDGVKASYGWGNEAIEIAFEHVNCLINEKGDNISQIILIGDAPPNTREQVKFKREKASLMHGQDKKYWKKTKFENRSFWASP